MNTAWVPGVLPPRERLGTITQLAIPIIGGMTSQNILNLVDTAMVGRLGPISLAAVGAGSFAVFMSVAGIQGLGAGVQAITARRVGEQNTTFMAQSLNMGLLLALVIGIPLTVLLWWFAPLFLPLIKNDPLLLGAMVPYYRARVLAIVAVGANFAFRGFWNGSNRPRLYLNTLLIAHSVNLILNYLLIFGHGGFPAMGVEGAGIASAIATVVGLVTYLFLGWRHAGHQGFMGVLPTWKGLIQLARLSVPAGIQQTFLAAGFVCLFWVIGCIGSTEMAAANVIMNLNLVGILPALGLGIAAGSLVGQALGRQNTDDAYQWGVDVVKVGVFLLALVAFPMICWPEMLFRLFTTDAETIRMGMGPLRLAGVVMLMEPFGMILLYALMGAGANRMTMVVTVSLQWGLGLPLAYLLGPYLGFGLMGVWVSQAIYRLGLGVAFVVLWRQGKWANIVV